MRTSSDLSASPIQRATRFGPPRIQTCSHRRGTATVTGNEAGSTGTENELALQGAAEIRWPHELARAAQGALRVRRRSSKVSKAPLEGERSNAEGRNCGASHAPTAPFLLFGKTEASNLAGVRGRG